MPLDAQSLQQLVDLSLQLGREREVDKVLQSVADALLELVDADRAFVILNGRHVVANAYAPGQSGGPSLSVAKFALSEGREVVTADISDHELSAARSVMNLQLRAVLCLPLLADGKVLGALYADSARRGHDELEELVGLGRAYAAHAAIALQNARLLAKARRQTRIARDAAHDIRNLAGSLEMGLDELGELELPEWANQTLDDVRKMNRLSLATATRALSTERTKHVGVGLADLARQAVGLMRFDARKTAVRFATSFDELKVLGNSDDLARLLANLLGNALKYSPPDSTVEVGIRATDRGMALLSVRDQGPGIPEDALDDVFRSGFQAEGAKEGHGLGLGICRTIVKQHHGRIRARNHPEGGAIFEALLPLSDTISER